MAKPRDYRKEYDTYHGTAIQKKRRAQRNAARSRAKALGLVCKGDGKEVDHKRPLSKNGGNGKGNLQVMSRSANRKKYNKLK